MHVVLCVWVRVRCVHPTSIDDCIWCWRVCNMHAQMWLNEQWISMAFARRNVSISARHDASRKRETCARNAEREGMSGEHQNDLIDEYLHITIETIVNSDLDRWSRPERCSLVHYPLDKTIISFITKISYGAIAATTYSVEAVELSIPLPMNSNR